MPARARCDDIQTEDWTLNISRHVPLPLQEATAAFKDALVRAREAEDRRSKVMTYEGWLQ